MLAMALLPILLTVAVVLTDHWWRLRNGRDTPGARFTRLLPLAYLGTLSHPLLDWLNTYGIRLLMPFDGRWFYGDTLFIIDPWIWLVLGGTVFLRHSKSRRGLLAWAVLAAATTAIFIAGSDGHPNARIVWFVALLLLVALRAGRQVPDARLAATALLATALYILLLYAGTVLARRDVESQITAAGAGVESLMVGPLPLRPLSHAVVIDTGTEYRVGSYEWFSEPRLLLDRRPLAKPPWTGPVAAAFRAPCLQGMVGWVRFPWVEIEQTEDGGHIVHLMDARYTRSRTSGFGGSSVRLRPDLSDVCDVERP